MENCLYLLLFHIFIPKLKVFRGISFCSNFKNPLPSKAAKINLPQNIFPFLHNRANLILSQIIFFWTTCYDFHLPRGTIKNALYQFPRRNSSLIRSWRSLKDLVYENNIIRITKGKNKQQNGNISLDNINF